MDTDTINLIVLVAVLAIILLVGRFHGMGPTLELLLCRFPMVEYIAAMLAYANGLLTPAAMLELAILMTVFVVAYRGKTSGLASAIAAGAAFLFLFIAAAIVILDVEWGSFSLGPTDLILRGIAFLVLAYLLIRAAAFISDLVNSRSLRKQMERMDSLGIEYYKPPRRRCPSPDSSTVTPASHAPSGGSRNPRTIPPARSRRASRCRSRRPP